VRGQQHHLAGVSADPDHLQGAQRPIADDAGRGDVERQR
jgi:hypothetical protein